jgi:hypothetical protein
MSEQRPIEKVSESLTFKSKCDGLLQILKVKGGWYEHKSPAGEDDSKCDSIWVAADDRLRGHTQIDSLSIIWKNYWTEVVLSSESKFLQARYERQWLIQLVCVGGEWYLTRHEEAITEIRGSANPSLRQIKEMEILLLVNDILTQLRLADPS